MALTYGFNLDSAGKTYTSAEFSEVFHQLTVDHVADYSGRLALALSGGLSFTISPGYLFAGGRWAKLTGSASYTLPIAKATQERYDAIAAIVHLNNRDVALEVLSDIDPDTPPRSSTTYAVYLYTFRIGMSATDLMPDDVTDRRQILMSYSGVASECDRIYRYFFSEFPAEVETIRAIGQDAIDAWPEDKGALILGHKTGMQYIMGDVMMSAVHPMPLADWLLCDGSAIPDGYSPLASLLGTDTLPALTAPDERLGMYIYATTGYISRSYSGYVEVDDDSPEMSTTTGSDTVIGPEPEPEPDDPDTLPTGAIITRGGEGILTRGGEFILTRRG